MQNGVTILNLDVVDSTFNAEKAKVLYDVLEKSSVKKFIFKNKALESNVDGSGYDDFLENMAPLKTLDMHCLTTWGSKIA